VNPLHLSDWGVKIKLRNLKSRSELEVTGAVKIEEKFPLSDSSIERPGVLNPRYTSCRSHKTRRTIPKLAQTLTRGPRFELLSLLTLE